MERLFRHVRRVHGGRWGFGDSLLFNPNNSGLPLYLNRATINLFSQFGNPLSTTALPSDLQDAVWDPESRMGLTFSDWPGGRNANINADFLGIINLSAPAPVPEPSTMLLLGSGLLGMVLYRKKQGLKKVDLFTTVCKGSTQSYGT